MSVQDREPAVLRHGAYLCVRVSPGCRAAVAALPIASIAERLALGNEFDAVGHPENAIGLLRRVDATPSGSPDATVLLADLVIHVASPSEETVTSFCTEMTRVLASYATVRVLRGGVRPTNYTGGLMHGFAYASQRQQEPGGVMPNAFLLPLSKTAAWWAKDWMERHTYFLPRYDEEGRQSSCGHALAAAPGIPHLMRRTYRHPVEPAPPGDYDFLTYFECADAGIPVFHQVCAALRDVHQNPEWEFVREGPTWQGRRFRRWAELFQ